MPYTLSIDLSADAPAARLSGDPGGDRSLEIGQVNSPNSPIGAAWAVEEIIAIATQGLAEPLASVAVRHPAHWGPTNRQAFAAALNQAELPPVLITGPDDVADDLGLPTEAIAVITPTPLDPVIPPTSQPFSEEPDPTPPSGYSKPPAPSAADLYSLPHIDDEPLPDFVVRRRGANTDAAPPPTSRPSSSGAGAGPEVRQPPGGAPPPVSRPVIPMEPSPTSVQPRQSTPVGPILDEFDTYEPGSNRRRLMVAFTVIVAVVAIGLYAMNRGSDPAGTDLTADPNDQTTAGDTTTPTDPDGAVDETTPDNAAPDGTPADEAPALVRNCEADQMADSSVRYRVSDIPERFEAQTLNGRNVPSVAAVDGVESRVITEFPEFSELPLDYDRCQLNENGRPWWGVQFDAGPNGIAWASTLYIEPVPAG